MMSERGDMSKGFKKYLCEEDHICSKLGFALHVQSLHDDQHNVADSEFRDLRHKILKDASHMFGKCLVQIWRAEEVISNENSDKRHFRLTTRNQPFLLTGVSINDSNNELLIARIVKSLYCGFSSYRSKMRDVIITGDGYGGAIGRVFQNKMMELSPDISYYSNHEYPFRDIALSCNIQWALTIPMFDNFGHTVGVVELVSYIDLYANYWSTLSPSSLAWSFRIEKKYVKTKDLHNAVCEINEVNKLVAGNLGIIFYQTWTLCKHCNYLSRLGIKLGASYTYSCKGRFIALGAYLCVLQNGEGIVGKAATSFHNLVYCEDVSKFSIAEYPFAHLARDYGLSSCFAISLKSDHTGDQVYVVECFLDSRYVEGKDLNATLVPILEAMRQNFKTFKFAFGEELGGYLPLQVVDASFEDKIETLKIRGISSIDKRIIEMEFINSRENLLIEERDVAIGSLEKQHTNSQTLDVEPERKLHTIRHQRGGVDISEKELMDVRKLKRIDAAKSLNVSVSTLKRVSRHYGIPRWPPRKTNTDHQSCFSNSTQAFSMEELRCSSPTPCIKSFVTIKAKYGNIFIKFQLLFSSGLDVFNEQVSKRLKLEVGNYIVKYQDEDNDWILVACDDDLQDFITNSALLGKKPFEIVDKHI